jgi:carbonic anhydrase
MRLFEAILEANHRAIAGDTNASLHPREFPDELPIVALTCVDPRLNRFFPGILGLPDDAFIWLRNAGNIITSPVSSTMRSLSLACAIKGGREIVIIGHTDCKVRHTTVSELLDRFKALGIDRHLLPENLTEYFGVFASEQQNVVRSVELVRHSPLIGAKIPVQGLMVDTATGKLDWIVNGYEALDRPVAAPASMQMPTIGFHAEDMISRAGAELKASEAKIGELTNEASQWAARKLPSNPPAAPAPQAAPAPVPPPVEVRRKIPIPPKIEPPSRVGKFRI